MPVDYYAGLWLCGVFITGMILMVVLEAVWDDVRRWWRNRKRKSAAGSGASSRGGLASDGGGENKMFTRTQICVEVDVEGLDRLQELLTKSKREADALEGTLEDIQQTALGINMKLKEATGGNQ